MRSTVREARGKPTLQWVGKKSSSSARPFPAQLVELFTQTKESKVFENPSFSKLNKKWHSLLFHGDNKEVMRYLLSNKFREQVGLIYIDPPFDSGANYVRNIRLRGNEKAELEGENYSLGEQIQYYDIWSNDNYLQFMYERLLLMKELLHNEGIIVVHSDWHRNHYLRLLLDEVFEPSNFLNEIIWYHWTKFQMRNMGSLTRNHDTLLVYAKNRGKHTFNPITRPLDRPKKLKRIYWDKDKNKIQNMKDEYGKVVYKEMSDEKVDDVWDIPHVGTRANERTNYPHKNQKSYLIM